MRSGIICFVAAALVAADALAQPRPSQQEAVRVPPVISRTETADQVDTDSQAVQRREETRRPTGARPVPQPVACHPAPGGMAFWAGFDDGFADWITGATGVPSTGVALQNATPPGHTGRSARLPNNQRINYALPSPISFGGHGYTIDAWVRLQPQEFGHAQIVRLEGPTGNVRFHLSDHLLGFASHTWVTNPQSGVYINTQIRIDNGQWRHVAVTVRPGEAGGGTIFLDGQPVWSFDTQALSGSGHSGPYTHIQIGSHFLSMPESAVYPMDIDEVEVFIHALDGNSVLTLAQRPKCRPGTYDIPQP